MPQDDVMQSGYGCEGPWPKGKQPRPTAKVSKSMLSGKGGGVADTSRRLAQKQPPFKESVIAHWPSDSAPKMQRGQALYRSFGFIVYYERQGSVLRWDEGVP
eukprot:TRINITY_DN0_c109_g3_i3.p3 TRINITY_DN0_c109_g3~~TRINITY_DN0_c109_g3_i3.p3  ORF type:complete len:102 (+),score=0.20 TRINITY_DN0_c109_g3_i3:245-550(+)